MDETEAKRELEKRLEGKTQREVAALAKVSEQYLSDVLNNRRLIGPLLQEWLGFHPKLVRTFEPKLVRRKP
jgi:transcriptional regulator with XRE-family HTH domain